MRELKALQQWAALIKNVCAKWPRNIMSSILQARLLGEFFLTCDDSPLKGAITERSQALLAYLLLNRYMPQPRSRLAFYLWPESTETQARTNLRKELSYLRRALPNADQWLLIDAKTLQWHPNVTLTLDVAQFEEALRVAHSDSGSSSSRNTAQAALEQALSLYRGELWPECDDEWLVPERERLQQMHINALEHFIDLLQEQRNYRSALNYAQQLLRIAPLNEATYCTLMRLYGLVGDRANALQIYHRCMTMLREELGVDPSSTTRKLFEQLLREDELREDPPREDRLREDPPREDSLRKAKPSVQLTPSARPLPSARLFPLVGREQEWNQMQQWVGTIAQDDASEVLLLLGEPGIGKTRLLEELRETMQAEQTGKVLWGRAFAAEMVRPYGIWIDALRSLELPVPDTLSTELGVLLPEMGQFANASPAMSPAHLRERSHLFDAVVQLLAEWANQSPLVIILDDIQWIDEASSALWHYAVRLLSHLPVRFACSARSAELKDNAAVSQVVQTLRREQRLKTVELAPLNRGQTVALVCNCQAVQAADLSVEVLDQVFTDSGGNPLFVLEVARALSHNHSPHAGNLEALIGDRLQQLDDGAREVLPWAAALGRSFKPTMVAQVADCPLPQLLVAIDQLERQAVIRPSTSMGNEMGYDFAHDIVRQVVYRQLSEPRRHLVHLQIAHKLNQLFPLNPALAGDIAHHAALGGDHELASSAALSAAERCLKLFAYAEASTLAQRGIQHSQPLDERTRIRLQLELLRIWAIAGVTGHQATQLEADIHRLVGEASRLGLKDEEAIGLEALGTLYFNQSNYTNIHQHSLRAIEVGRTASPVTAARLLAFTGSCLAELGQDLLRAEALLLEAQSLAARVGMEFCDLYGGLGSVYIHKGDYDAARPLLQQAWRSAQVEQDHWRECNCLNYLVMTELETDNAIAALSYCHEAASLVAKIQGEGSEGAVTMALAALVNYRLQQPGSEAVLEEAIANLILVDAKRVLAYVLIGAAEVDLDHGRQALAAIRAETALQAAQIMKHPSEKALAWTLLIQSLLALGEPERAMAEFEAWRQDIDRHALSARAQTAIDDMMWQLQKVSPVAFHSSTNLLSNQAQWIADKVL